MSQRITQSIDSEPNERTPLDHARNAHGDRVAVVDGDLRVTYDLLGGQADALARYLVSRGVAPGDRVSALLVNSHAYVVTYFGVAQAGAILNPLNHRLSTADLAFILADAGSRWLVADVRFAARVIALMAGGSPVEGVVWVGGDSAPELSLVTVAMDAVLESSRPRPRERRSVSWFGLPT